MRIDHIAYRVRDRYKTAQFFIDGFGYRIDPELPEGFTISFDDGSSAQCLVLLPPEKLLGECPWNMHGVADLNYHMAPELFISDGQNQSVVEKWVATKNGGIGGIHHVAYQVESVEDKMKEFKEKGIAEFTTEEPIRCKGLTQVFTKPTPYTGIIYEFIERGKHGFCRDSVKFLMESTRDFT